jgi:Zn-dependent protease
MEHVFLIVILLFSIIIHEVAHGSVANLLGDSTAKLAGRLTLNPLKHLDPFGSVLLPLFLIIIQSPIKFGWAKPVPINPYNFKDQKWDGVKTALAGPVVNILIALIFGLSIRYLSLPLPFLTIFSLVIIINLVLAFFNLIPIPPLDGSHLLFALLPKSLNEIKIFLRRYSLFILMFFILFGLDWVFALVVKSYFFLTGYQFII